MSKPILCFSKKKVFSAASFTKYNSISCLIEFISSIFICDDDFLLSKEIFACLMEFQENFWGLSFEQIWNETKCKREILTSWRFEGIFHFILLTRFLKLRKNFVGFFLRIKTYIFVSTRFLWRNSFIVDGRSVSAFNTRLRIGFTIIKSSSMNHSKKFDIRWMNEVNL